MQESKSTVANQAATISQLESTVVQQRKGMEALTAGLKGQASQIQKVSAQLAAASPSYGGLEASNLGRKWSRIPRAG